MDFNYLLFSDLFNTLLKVCFLQSMLLTYHTSHVHQVLNKVYTLYYSRRNEQNPDFTWYKNFESHVLLSKHSYIWLIYWSFSLSKKIYKIFCDIFHQPLHFGNDKLIFFSDTIANTQLCVCHGNLYYFSSETPYFVKK